MTRGAVAGIIIGEVTTVISAWGLASHLLPSAGLIPFTRDMDTHTMIIAMDIHTIATVTLTRTMDPLGIRLMNIITTQNTIMGLFIDGKMRHSDESSNPLEQHRYRLSPV